MPRQGRAQNPRLNNMGQVCADLNPRNQEREVRGAIHAAALPGRRRALILTLSSHSGQPAETCRHCQSQDGPELGVRGAWACGFRRTREDDLTRKAVRCSSLRVNAPTDPPCNGVRRNAAAWDSMHRGGTRLAQ